jgi:hypothetical protein
MRAPLILALMLGLAACSQPPAKTADPAAGKPAAPPRLPTEWAFGMGKNSVELVHLVGGDARDPDLRMVCAKADGFLILLPRVTPIGSEERLTFGAGDLAHVLVATASKTGVQATGPVEPALVAILQSDQPLAASYGATNVGPFAPPPALRRAFREACARLQATGHV